MTDIAGEQCVRCNEMLNHIYKITVNISVKEKTARVISYREDESMVGQEIFLEMFPEKFDELDAEARAALREILSQSELCQVLDAEVVKKDCLTVQINHNIYSKYIISLYPIKHLGRIYMTVADYEHTDNTITLMFKKNAVNIRLSDIYYVDYGNHSVEVHSTQGHSSFFSVSFSDVADRLLKHGNFLRSYKNCIVNMDRIVNVTVDSFIMDNGESISIPKRRLKEIKKYYDDYCKMK
ncbi:MAG: LytTR family transcriptional regulator DNA-binding domain-containing protein [Clostridia bacterium]|nr:LytTR family transcriptional regulator DNA-binding domain-containing protein [Clostridia bacterium]